MMLSEAERIKYDLEIADARTIFHKAIRDYVDNKIPYHEFYGKFLWYQMQVDSKHSAESLAIKKFFADIKPPKFKHFWEFWK